LFLDRIPATAPGRSGSVRSPPSARLAASGCGGVLRSEATACSTRGEPAVSVAIEVDEAAGTEAYFRPRERPRREPGPHRHRRGGPAGTDALDVANREVAVSSGRLRVGRNTAVGGCRGAGAVGPRTGLSLHVDPLVRGEEGLLLSGLPEFEPRFGPFDLQVGSGREFRPRRRRGPR
jgi:hypothetical protein